MRGQLARTSVLHPEQPTSYIVDELNQDCVNAIMSLVANNRDFSLRRMMLEVFQDLEMMPSKLGPEFLTAIALTPMPSLQEKAKQFLNGSKLEFTITYPTSDDLIEMTFIVTH